MDQSNMTDMYLYKYNKYKVLSNQNPNKQIYRMKMNYYENEISGGGIKSAIRKNICQESGRLRLFAYIASLKTGKVALKIMTSQGAYIDNVIVEDYNNQSYKEKVKADLEEKTNKDTLKGCVNSKIDFEGTNNNNEWDKEKWKKIDGKSGIHSKGKTILEYLLDDTFCTGVNGEVRMFLLKEFIKSGAKLNCTLV